MNYRRLLELYWEMDAFWKKMHGLYLDAIIGFSLVHDTVQQNQQRIREILGDVDVYSEEFQDTTIFGSGSI